MKPTVKTKLLIKCELKVYLASETFPILENQEKSSKTETGSKSIKSWSTSNALLRKPITWQRRQVDSTNSGLSGQKRTSGAWSCQLQRSGRAPYRFHIAQQKAWRQMASSTSPIRTYGDNTDKLSKITGRFSSLGTDLRKIKMCYFPNPKESENAQDKRGERAFPIKAYS